MTLSFENRITNGYGEFVVYYPNKEIPSLNEEEYFRIYELFSKYSPGGLISNQGEVVTHDRFTLISQEVSEINPHLKVVFVPKTLYELVLLRKIIKEDVKNNKCCPGAKRNDYQDKIRSVTHEIEKLERDKQKTAEDYAHIADLEKRNRYICEDIKQIDLAIDAAAKEIMRYREKERRLQSKKCWHHIPIKKKGNLEDNVDVRVKNIAYRLNQTFAKICSSNETPFSFKTISSLVEKELQFFITYAQQGKVEEDKNLPLPSFIKSVDSPTRLFRYTGSSAYGRSLAICNENEVDFIRQVVQAECSKVATNSVLLYRVRSTESDSVIYQQKPCEAMSLSFGTSLFAGIMHDIDATVWCLARNRKSTFYMIQVPINEIDSSCIYFPRANTICQLFSQGETFHGRTKVPEGQIVVHGIQAGPGSSDIKHLYVKMNLSQIKEQFETFNDATLLEINPC